MAYRRRGERISEAKKMRAKSKERSKIQRALDQVEFAKQREARKRASSKGIGSAIGDFAYVTGHGGGRRTDIEKATDALRKLEESALFAETREAAERGVAEGEFSQEQIAEGDLETGLLDMGSEALKNYMTAITVGKAFQKAGETAAEGFKTFESKIDKDSVLNAIDKMIWSRRGGSRRETYRNLAR